MGNGRWVFAAGCMGRGDGLCCMGHGARRDWCVTERGCQWEIVVSSGTRTSSMHNGSGGFHPWRCGKGDLTLGCAMGDATLGDVGCTLGAL